MNSKDSIVYTDEYYSLYDEEEGEVEFHMVARITLADKQYAVFEDPDDEESLMVFTIEPDEEESERIFYLFEAAYDEYDFGEAT